MTALTRTGELTWPGELAAFAERLLGPCTLIGDLSWPYEGSEVYRIRDTRGVDHILKRLINRRFFRMEVDGYQWTPALGTGRAPRLEAADEELLAVIVTFLPGAPMLGEIDPLIEIPSYHQLGRLLARLHVGGPATGDTAVLERLLERAEGQLAKAAGEVTAAQHSLARQAAEILADLMPVLAAVPTHGDLQARNVLLDPSTGTVALIDFERSALAPAVRDLVRLEAGAFRRPELRAAFYDGYGRVLDTAEQHALRAWVVLDSVSALAWGIPNNDTEIVQRARAALADSRFTDLDQDRLW